MCKRIYLCCCCLALLASCQKNVVDDGVDPVEWSDEPIKFSLSISGAGAGVTRAYDNRWESSDRLGIYMVPYVAAGTAVNFTTYADAQNKEYTTDNINGDKADLVEVSEYLRYPANGDGVSFVAYYPYRSTLASSDSHVYPVNVTNQASPQAIDLLYGDTKGGGTSGSGGKGYTLADNPVTMAFSHQLTKLVVKLGNGQGMDVDYSSASASLTISGIPTRANFSLATAALSNLSGDGVNIIPVQKEKVKAGVTWEAIVIPHAASAYQKRELMFTVSGNQYSVFLPDDVNFEGGKVYTFQCVLTSTDSFKVEFSDQCTITNWTDAAKQNDLAVEDAGPVAALTDVSSLTDVPDGMTNSYVVVPNGELAFKVSRAFVYESTAFTDKLRVDEQNTYTGKFGAEVVWETEKVIRSLAVEGSGKDAKVSLYTYNTEGNAVVKIYKIGDAAKTAVWSYHIWVTNYDPAQDAGWNPANNGGSTTRDVSFMDRNLGALEAANSVRGRGLFYQWGRKDPFPAKDNVGSFRVADGGSGVTIVQAIQNPGTFYWMANGVNGNDWLASARDNSLWGGDEADKPKTIYDPCPAGWRVPFSGADTDSPWSGYAVQTYDGATPVDERGYVLPFDNNDGQYTQSYWPAAGYRYRTTGGLASPGAYGYYWSAMVMDAYAYRLNFYSGYISPNGTYDRVSGLSVRCVKE